VKALLYALLAALDFTAAWYFFAQGRVVLPTILAAAGLCFVAATIGTLMGKGASPS
jgi:hypothetical protein